MKLIIYMPAMNEEENIQSVIHLLPETIAGIDQIEYLVVDDGSTDQTVEISKSLGAHVVSHGRNRGVGAAFQSAVQYALENDADILVSIDADGQFDAGEIPKLIEPILEYQAEMVIGNRFVNNRPESMPKLKYWGNRKLASLVSYLCNQKFQDVSCGFRAYNREAMMRLNIFGNFTYTHETILSLVFQGLRVYEQPIKVFYDPERKSRVAASTLHYGVQTSKIILRVILDYQPIRMFGGLGTICLVIGIIFEIFLIVHYFISGQFTPFKSFGFIGLGFIIFGMLVLLIALISDMLNRIRKNQDRILFEIKKSTFRKE
jgi:glycosyltransferase involved in cell wall biosynthesis